MLAGEVISSGVLMEVQLLNAQVEFCHALIQAGQLDPMNPHNSQRPSLTSLCIH